MARLPNAVRFDLGDGTERAPWRITLYIPPGKPPSDGWPVLYLLDGNALVGTAIDIERVQAPYPGGTGIHSRFAIVGIGYPTEAAYDSVRRSWDFSPPPGSTYPPHTPDGPAVKTGGAAAFLDFLTNQLRAAIEQRCRIDRTQQALFGHSFGGLFVLYALAKVPTAFSCWIAASPTIYWENYILLKSIEDFERKPSSSTRIMLLAAGYEEELAPFQRDAPDHEARLARLKRAQTVELTRAMAERLGKIRGVAATFRMIRDRTHMAMLPDALNDAVFFFMSAERGQDHRR